MSDIARLLTASRQSYVMQRDVLPNYGPVPAPTPADKHWAVATCRISPGHRMRLVQMSQHAAMHI